MPVKILALRSLGLLASEGRRSLVERLCDSHGTGQLKIISLCQHVN